MLAVVGPDPHPCLVRESQAVIGRSSLGRWQDGVTSYAGEGSRIQREAERGILAYRGRYYLGAGGRDVEEVARLETDSGVLPKGKR